MKKTLTAVLAALLLLTSAACSTKTENAGGEQDKQTATAQNPGADLGEDEEETARFLDSMPETMDFEGRGLNFLLTEGSNGNITELSLWAEEDTGEVVDSAVYRRNL